MTTPQAIATAEKLQALVDEAKLSLDSFGAEHISISLLALAQVGYDPGA
jgi:hypothetical protein